MADKEDWKRAFFAALAGTAAIRPEVREGSAAVIEQLFQDTGPSGIARRAAEIADAAVAEIEAHDERVTDEDNDKRVLSLALEAMQAFKTGSSVTLQRGDPEQEVIELLKKQGIDAEVMEDPDFRQKTIVKKK